GKADISVLDLKSSLVDADNMLASVNLDNGFVRLASLNLNYESQSLKILNKPKVYSINSNQLLPDSVELEMSNLKLGNILSVLPSLNPLKGELSGLMNFKYQDGNLFFRPY